MELKSEFKAAFKDGWLLVGGLFGAWSVLNLLGLELKWDQLKRLAAAYDELLNWAWSHVTIIDMPMALQQLIALIVIYSMIALRAYISQPNKTKILIDEEGNIIHSTTRYSGLLIALPFAIIAFYIFFDESLNFSANSSSPYEAAIHLSISLIACMAFATITGIISYRIRAYISTLLAMGFIILLDWLVYFLNHLLAAQPVVTL